MDQLKRLIGIVAGIFCTLVAAWICSYVFKFDGAWYGALVKPSFMLPRGYFTAFVAVTYLSCILSISRLVTHKRFFPSMLYFFGLGTCSVLFVLAFFNLKRLVLALVFITATLAFAYALFIRFLMKDVKIALLFLPAFSFYIYGFLCAVSVALAN